MRLSVGLILILSGLASSASALELAPETGLDRQKQELANAVIGEVRASLPAVISQALPFTISIGFENLKSKSADRLKLGRSQFSRRRIVLNERAPSLKKVLAHEIAHFYDRANVDTAEVARLRGSCAVADGSSLSDPLCSVINAKNSSISLDPEFMAMTGWVMTSTGVENINNFKRRLPDAYAVESIEETFPTLFEYYLFDPQFKCRMPAVSDFFDKRFRVPRSQSMACDETQSWYFGGSDFKTIAKSQIYAVEFLWAAEGREPSSFFGHSMLRLVVCRPGRPPGPDCYSDFDQHVVLSAAATTETLDYGNYRGLSGQYPLNLLAMSIFKAKMQYNSFELRDLYAIPLNLNPSQKSRLIDLLYESHWNLDGKYYYLSRNCTTEIARLILAAGVSIEVAMTVQSNSPSDLFRKLLKSPLNASQHRTRSALAKDTRYYFESRRKTIDVALDVVSRALGQKLSSEDAYIKKMDAEGFTRLLFKAQVDQRLAYATHYLEQIRHHRLAAKMMAESFDKGDVRATEMMEASNANAALNYSYRFPGSFLTRESYGQPSAHEASVASAALIERYAKDSKSLEGLNEAAERQLEEFKKDLDQSSQRLRQVLRILSSRSKK